MAAAPPGFDPSPLPAPDARGRPWRGKWWRRGGLATCVLVAGGWMLGHALPYMVLCPSRAERWAVYGNRTPASLGLAADDLSVEAEPGLWLHGWHVPAKGPARGTVVLLHGHSSCKEAMLGLARLFSEHGYQCLLYDSRAHGESGGAFCTFGFYERRDFSRVVDAAERRFGPSGPLAVYGNSLGGAVALQTLAVEPRLRCGIVESPFATLREIVHDYMEHYSGLPFFFLSDWAVSRAERLAHFSADAVNPERAAGGLRQPVLLAHGTNDHWIAFRYGERIAGRLHAPGSLWHPVPGADHGDLWQKGGAEYQKLVLDFLDLHCR